MVYTSLNFSEPLFGHFSAKFSKINFHAIFFCLDALKEEKIYSL